MEKQTFEEYEQKRTSIKGFRNEIKELLENFNTNTTQMER